MTPVRRTALLLALSAALAPARVAAAPALADRRVLLEVAGRSTTFEYAEYGATGARLDAERGAIPGVEGALEVREGPVALRATLAAEGAQVAYAGLVQSGSTQLNGLAVTSTSGAHLTRAGGELALALPGLRGAALLAGLERRRWDRNIHGTTVVSRSGVLTAVRGLDEVYAWDVLHAGVRLPLLASPRLGWDLEGRVTRTHRPSVTVAWPGGDVRLPLGERLGWAAGTTVRVALGPVLVARLGFSLARHDFGESEVDARTLVFEPRSTTRTASFEAGLGARF
jgi:hypothetical protein